MYKLFLDRMTGAVAGAYKEGACRTLFLFSDSENTDYQDYLRWLDAGNTPDPADPLPPAPIPSASAWQVRKALNLLGWRDDVEAYVAQADITVKDGWLTARDYFRDDPFVVGVGQLLGKTDEQMNDFFRLASTL